jgi:predicted nucleic-acid-binding protein
VIGADANILLRLLLDDDPVQVGQVRERLDRAVTDREDVFVSPIALAETVWTLAHQRKVPAAEITSAIRAMSNTRPFRMFDDPVVGTALDLFEAGRTGFSDCIIRAMDAAAGCRSTLTFDRRALTLPGFLHPTAEG